MLMYCPDLARRERVFCRTKNKSQSGGIGGLREVRGEGAWVWEQDGLLIWQVQDSLPDLKHGRSCRVYGPRKKRELESNLGSTVQESLSAVDNLVAADPPPAHRLARPDRQQALGGLR